MADAPIPPQNLDAEESVLGAMMMSLAAVEAVSEIVTDTDFYRASHAKIYRACLDLWLNGLPVDAITVADRLEIGGLLEDVGGKQRIHEIASLVPAASNAAHYARIVREMADLRGLASAGDAIQRLASDRPAATGELLAEAERVVFDLGHRGRASSEFVAVRDTLAAAFTRLRELHDNPQDVGGVPSGYRALDKITGGFMPGNLIVLAARPSMGKTALALGIAAHVTLHERKPVGLFTLEMNRDEVTQRLLSAVAFVESQKIRSGRLDEGEWRRLHEAGSKLDAADLFIYDDGALTLSEIRSKARRLKLRHPDLALVVVDYLQLMTAGRAFDNRVQEVSLISRVLKVLAGELQVPVLALSQLSRQVEQRHDKHPILSDLRESGSIEQDADVVMFIYRDEYYHPESAAEDGTEGLADVIVAKQRNGPTGEAKLAFVKRHVLFGDLAPEV